jgi:hypothetical protein
MRPRKVSPAVVQRAIQEAVARATNDYIMSDGFTAKLVSEVSRDLSDRIALHPNVSKLIKSEVGREVSGAIVKQKPSLFDGLADIKDKSEFAKKWIVFAVGIGLLTYAGVMLIQSLFGSDE